MNRSVSLILSAAVALPLALVAQPSPQFSVSINGHTYSVTISSIPQSGFQFAGHWLYEPSGILPSPQTGYQYYVLFSSNQDANNAQFGREAIYLTTSANGYSSFSTPTAILDLSTVSNICDIADARPIWDGSLWHVYVQGNVWTGGSCNPPAYIFEATGPALQSGQLHWVTSPGTNAAMPIITSRSLSGIGIGESIQWFYTTPYTGLSQYPFLGIYNDWNFTTPDPTYCPTCSGNGTPVFGYLSADGINNQYFWYYTSPAIGNGSNGLIILNPDVILGHSLEEATAGDPAIALGADSSGASGIGRGLGFWSTIAPYPSGSIGPGNFDDHTFSSSYSGTIDNPKFARNVYGYLDPTSIPHRAS